MTVYFAQPTNGGPIKVGQTRDIKARMTTLGSWMPGGVEVIATIDGGPVREASLKWLLADYSLMGEWLRSCVPIWRVITEAAETGDLAWLPRISGVPTSAEVSAELKSLYGSRAAGIRALGSHGGILASADLPNFRASPTIVGRLLAEKVRRDGRLPSFLQPQTIGQDAAA